MVDLPFNKLIVDSIFADAAVRFMEMMLKDAKMMIKNVRPGKNSAL